MTSTKNETTEAPTLAPRQKAESGGTDAGGMSRPIDLRDGQVGAAAAGTTEQAPALSPPGTAGATAAASGVTGTWTSGVMVDATWSINETRNAYFHATGGAWKKIWNGSDGAFTAMVTLASQAKQSGRQMQIREEADGMVHEIYLW